MTSCKNCYHYDVCVYENGYDEIEMRDADSCALFQDKRKIVELKCKPGDTIYRPGDPIKKVYEWYVAMVEIYEDEIIYMDDSDNTFADSDIGRTVFLTREEAEQALKEKSNE